MKKLLAIFTLITAITYCAEIRDDTIPKDAHKLYTEETAEVHNTWGIVPVYDYNGKIIAYNIRILINNKIHSIEIEEEIISTLALDSFLNNN